MILFHLEVIQVLSVPHVPSGGYVTFVFSVSNVLYKNYQFCLEVVLVLCVPYVPSGDYATFVCFCVPSALMCFVCPLCFLCNVFCQ